MRKAPVMACLDLESVLIPELWVELADAFGLDELRLTTRQIADKVALNQLRLRALKKAGITVKQIQRALATVEPLRGAAGFLKWLNSHMPFMVVSDCYWQLAKPVLAKLGVHAMVAHSWRERAGKITALPLRVSGDTKAPVVKLLQAQGFEVVAMGDSLNDVGMLKAANLGLFYKASPRAIEAAPKLPVCQNYTEAKARIQKWLG